MLVWKSHTIKLNLLVGLFFSGCSLSGYVLPPLPVTLVRHIELKSSGMIGDNKYDEAITTAKC